MYIDFKEGLSLVIKVVAIVLALIALMLNFRGKWILETFLKKDTPSQNLLLGMKFTALIIAIIAFVLVFLA